MLPLELCEALAEDLAQLIRLHDRELDIETIAALQAVSFPDNLALVPAEAAALLCQAVPVLVAMPLESLAADYAAVYLTGACGASPCESVWTSDEGLQCEAPMFELARLYADHGLVVADRRQRYDDHLVCQLQFLQHLLLQPAPEWQVVVCVLDEHLGYWIGDFAQRVAARSDNAFYAGLALLTAQWLDALRGLVADLAGLPRTPHEVIEQRINSRQVSAVQSVAPIRFMPGTGPVL